MADPLTMLQPGDPIPTSVAVWNPLLRAAAALRDQKRAAPPADQRRTTGHVEALAFNDTGADLPKYKPAKVTGTGPYTLTSDGAAAEWNRRPVVTLGVPAATTDMVAVTLEAIPDGAFGRVAVAGWCACDVDIGNAGHGYASPTTDTDALVSGATGSVRILATGTGTARRTAVYLGDQVAGSGGGGSLTSASTLLTGTTTLGSATGVYNTILSLSSVPTGTYLFFATISAIFQTNTPGDRIDGAVSVNGAAGFPFDFPVTSIQVSGVEVRATGSVCFSVAVTTGGLSVDLLARRVFGGTVATSQVRGLGVSGSNFVTSLSYILR